MSFPFQLRYPSILKPKFWWMHVIDFLKYDSEPQDYKPVEVLEIDADKIESDITIFKKDLVIRIIKKRPDETRKIKVSRR